MGFLGGIFGRRRLRAPRPEKVAALVVAAERLRLPTGEKAGILFNPEEGASPSELADDIEDVLTSNGAEVGTPLEIHYDEFETAWIVVGNGDFRLLVFYIHTLNEALFERGNGDRLLAAAFGVHFEKKNAYWIFNYKRGYFYPLVRGADGARDNEAELRLGEAMERHRVAVESSLEHWYGLSGIPF